MTITISSSDPVLRYLILAFIDKVGAENASNTAIAGMIWREFRTVATPNQVAGIVSRMGIGRGGMQARGPTAPDGTNAFWSAAEISALRADWADGVSIRAISRKTGKADSTITKKIRELDLPRRASLVGATEPRAWTEERNNEVRRRAAAGMTRWEIAVAMGCSLSAIRGVFDRLGLQSRPIGRPGGNVPSRLSAPGIRSSAHQQKARRIGLAVQTSVQGPTLAPLPVAPEPSPVTSGGHTPSAWFGGQVALPAPRAAMPDWMTRPIPRAKACLFPLWADHQRCGDVAQPFCDAPTLVTRDYNGEPKVHVYCGKHHAVAHTRMVKSANQAPTW